MSQATPSVAQNLDKLTYESIQLDDSEWDNIPQILTKTCLNLDKYLSSTIKFVTAMHNSDQQQQHSKDLQRHQNLITAHKKMNEEAIACTEIDISNIQDEIKKAKERENTLMNYYAEFGKENMSKFVKVADGELEMEAPGYHHIQNKQLQSSYKEGSSGGGGGGGDGATEQDVHNIPKMFTLNQLRDLIYRHLNRSNLKEQVLQTIQKQEKMQDQIQGIFMDNEVTRAMIYKEKEEIEAQIIKQDQLFEEYKKKIEVELTQVATNVKQMSKAMQNALQGVKQQDNTILIVQDKIEKFKSSMIRQQDQLVYKQKELEKSLDHALKKMEDESIDMQNRMNEQMETQVEKFEDLISRSKDMIIGEVQNDIQAGETKIMELKVALNEQFDTFVDELDRKVGKLGAKGDTFTLQVENKFAKVSKQIKTMDKAVYKLSIKNPSTLGSYVAASDPNGSSPKRELKDQENKLSARLFAIETAINQNEQEAKAELNQIKMHFKKLIITFQNAEFQIQEPVVDRSQKSILDTQTNNQASQFVIEVNQHHQVTRAGELPQIHTESQKRPQKNSTLEFLDQQNEFAQHSQFKSKKGSQKKDPHCFDRAFYQRLYHIERALEQDPVEFQQIREYYQNQIKSSHINVTLDQKALDQYQQQQSKLHLVSKQALLNKGNEKSKYLINNNSQESNITSQAAKNNQSMLLEKAKELSKHKQIDLHNIDKKKFSDQALPKRNYKYVSLQNSPMNSKTKLKMAENSMSLVRDDIDMAKSDSIVGFENQWDIRGQIKKRRDSFQKRLQLNQTTTNF